eukprot:Amastigsp_a177065_21.p4 type:complete len:105 gc:universal Amastigsp_a177065_21:1049-735(-)
MSSPRAPKTSATPVHWPVVSSCPNQRMESRTVKNLREVVIIESTSAPRCVSVEKMKSCPSAEVAEKIDMSTSDDGWRFTNASAAEPSPVSTSAIAMYKTANAFV